MKKPDFLDKSDLKFIGWNIAAAIVVGIVILIVLIAYLRRYTEHGVEVDVTDVRGLVVARRPGLASGGGGLHVFGQSAVRHYRRAGSEADESCQTRTGRLCDDQRYDQTPGSYAQPAGYQLSPGGNDLARYGSAG